MALSEDMCSDGRDVCFGQTNQEFDTGDFDLCSNLMGNESNNYIINSSDSVMVDSCLDNEYNEDIKCNKETERSVQALLDQEKDAAVTHG
ncbi:hypothetical protein ACF0H5_015537 [Mactra antiquata]